MPDAPKKVAALMAPREVGEGHPGANTHCRGNIPRAEFGYTGEVDRSAAVTG